MRLVTKGQAAQHWVLEDCKDQHHKHAGAASAFMPVSTVVIVEQVLIVRQLSMVVLPHLIGIQHKYMQLSVYDR